MISYSLPNAVLYTYIVDMYVFMISIDQIF